jgi:hypothetical protein
MKKLLISTLLVATTASLSAQTVVDQWLFDDPTGTLLDDTANTGTPGTGVWEEGLLFETNGAGQYVVGNGIAGQAYKNFTPSVIGGTMTYEVIFGDWDLDTIEGGNFRNLGITLRDSVAETNLVDLQMNNRTNDRLRFRISTSNGDYGNAIVPGFDDGDIPIVNTGTSYSFLLTLDMLTGAYSAQVTVGDASPVMAGSGNFTLESISGLDSMRLYMGNQDWGSATSDNFIDIESITLTSTVPEPSTYALLLGLFSLCAVAIRRRKS